MAIFAREGRGVPEREEEELIKGFQSEKSKGTIGRAGGRDGGGGEGATMAPGRAG